MSQSLLKKTLLRMVLLGACAAAPVMPSSAPAQAADLVPLYKAPPPVYPSWTGFYVGGELGGKWADGTWTATSLRDRISRATASSSAIVAPLSALSFSGRLIVTMATRSVTASVRVWYATGKNLTARRTGADSAAHLLRCSALTLELIGRQIGPVLAPAHLSIVARRRGRYACLAAVEVRWSSVGPDHLRRRVPPCA